MKRLLRLLVLLVVIALAAPVLAAVLPNPREWSPDRPTPYIAGRADVISRRMGQLGPLLACVGQH